MGTEQRNFGHSVSAAYEALSPHMSRMITFGIAFIGGFAALYLPRVIAFLSSLNDTELLNVMTSLYTGVAVAFALFIALYVTLEANEVKTPLKDVLRTSLLAPAVLASLLNVNMQSHNSEDVNAQLNQALKQLADKSGISAPIEAAESFELVDPLPTPLDDGGVGVLDFVIAEAYAQDAANQPTQASWTDRQLRAPTQTVGQRLGVQSDSAQYVVVLKTLPKDQLAEAKADVLALQQVLPTATLARSGDGTYRVLLSSTLLTRYDATMQAIDAQSQISANTLDGQYKPALVRLQAPATK
jgi:hypothetical protein